MRRPRRSVRLPPRPSWRAVVVATNYQQPDHTAPDEGFDHDLSRGFDHDLSRAVDRARLAYEAALSYGDPNQIATTGEALRRLEELIPEPDR
jgi:hypothetical protein